MMDGLMNEELGCALLYSFTKGYGKPVPVKIYDYVLPLLFNAEVSKSVKNNNTFEDFTAELKNQHPTILNNLKKMKYDCDDITSKSLALAIIKHLLKFEMFDEMCGVILGSNVLDFNEAIKLGNWFSSLDEEHIKMIYEFETKKIVILDAESLGQDIDISMFNDFGDFTIYQRTSADEVVARIKDASYVLTNKVLLTKEVIDEAPLLEYIGITATGLNNVDLEYCKEKGIEVRNVAGYSTNIVAQHTFSLLLYLYEKMAYYDNYVKSGEYTDSPMFTHISVPFHELEGKTWGIVGLGQIGRKVADIATAFGCKVIYYSASGRNNDPVYEKVDFETLLSQSDIVSIHAPLNEYTNQLFSAKAFATMKPTAYLINVGRGPIINEEELAFALKHNMIAGAALDVLCVEPMTKDNPLLPLCDSNKLVITPHIAWASVEARNRLVKSVYAELKGYIEK